MDWQKWKTIVSGAKNPVAPTASVLAERSTCPSSRQLKGKKKKKTSHSNLRGTFMFRGTGPLNP